MGKWLFAQFEDRVLRRIPLYGIVKETVQQVMGRPFAFWPGGIGAPMAVKRGKPPCYR